jgi:hypothetical protein
MAKLWDTVGVQAGVISYLCLLGAVVCGAYTDAAYHAHLIVVGRWLAVGGIIGCVGALAGCTWGVIWRRHRDLRRLVGDDDIARWHQYCQARKARGKTLQHREMVNAGEGTTVLWCYHRQTPWRIGVYGLFAPREFWVGLYWNKRPQTHTIGPEVLRQYQLYCCLIPTLPVCVQWKRTENPREPSR